MRYLYRDPDNTTPLKTDRFGDSTYLDFYLAPIDGAFVKLVRGSYINISTVTYPNWFTGYIIAEPELLPLGKKGGTPVWAYKYRATADEYVLSLKPLGVMKPFLNTTMGAILKQLIQQLVPDTFDVSNIADGPFVAQYAVDPNSKFIDITQDFTQAANFRFYGNNKKLYFVAQDDASGAVAVDGSNKFAAIMDDGSSGSGGASNDNSVSPGLEMRPSSDPILNDITVQGDLEPQVYCNEYFMGTGFDSAFNLAESVYGVDASVLIDEQFSGSSISNNWIVFDPATYLQVSNGYLNALGGDGSGNYTASLQSVNPLPLSGKMRFTHGEWDFLGTGVGIICSCWTQTLNSGLHGCVYGLKVNGTTINPIANGVLDPTRWFIIDPSKRYVLRTLVSFQQHYRAGQTYSYIDKTGVRHTLTKPTSADTSVWQTLISEIDPTTGLLTKQATFTDTVQTDDATLYATYVPLASDSLHATVTNITVSVPLNATLEFSTVVPFENMNFEQWDDANHPTHWVNFSTPGPSAIGKGTNGLDGFCLELINSSSQTPKVYQSATSLIQPNTTYFVYGQVAVPAANLIQAGDQLRVTLLGTGVTETGVFLDLKTAIPRTGLGMVPFYGTLTTGMGTIPTDLALNVYWHGTGSYNTLVDNLVVTTDWKQQIMGPNEIDAMDGLAPVATIVQSNTGADTYNSYTGSPQYNPGQPQLVFFKDSITYTSDTPPANQAIRLSYRSAAGAIGRAISTASINTEAMQWGDNGVRNIIRNDLTPRPQTSAECEVAAAALVQENAFEHYEGLYTQFSKYLTQEPKSGAIIQFSNVAALGNLAEEINEVDTTFESAGGAGSSELFIHKITFGKPDRINQLLKKYATVRGAFQPSSASQPNVPPVDVSAITSLYYAADITKPVLLGWSDNYFYFDLGVPLGTKGLFYELRYSDDSWGCDPAKNLIAQTVLQQFILPRALRGKAIFARLVNKGNYMLWSEDQSQAGTYTHSNATLTMSRDTNPDGFQSNIGHIVYGTGGGTFSGIYPASGPGTNGCVSVSVKGPVGKSVTLTMRGTASTVTTPFTGYWQRISLPVTIPTIGSGSTNQFFDLTTTSAFNVSATRYSLELNTSSETMYVRTGNSPYGPSSRYTSMLKVSFPAPASLANIDPSSLVFQPTY